jgi:phosphate-selective porin OprO/OprP
MKITKFSLALLASSALSFATAANAQDAPAGDVAAESDADTLVQPEAPQTNEELAARAAFLEAQLESIQEQLNELKGQMTKATPTWKGAPLFENKDGGWSFKVRGRLQYDAGWVGHPDGVSDRGLGFSNEVRRARLGVEGDVPGGFGYKFELDFAAGDVEFADAILSYEFMPSAELAIGHHNNFQSLEELTSSRFISFMERAAFTDAFNFERRIGVSATYSSGDVMASAGVFTDTITDLANDENNSMSFDGRIVYMPKLGETQIHVGGSAHFRNNRDLAETGVTTRYRQRPLVHTTDTRFISTPALLVEEETHYGLELAAIHGPIHGAGEVHWLDAQRMDPLEDAKFFGGYAEVGYFLTGETRGYKNGTFDRTKVLKPVTDGGAGAFQINLRYDYLDLNDSDAGVIGGKQKGYQAAIIWIPMDYVRFMLNYGHMSYTDAAIAAEGGDRDYSIDVFGARAQIDW